jgi:hypothetical protein
MLIPIIWFFIFMQIKNLLYRVHVFLNSIVFSHAFLMFIPTHALVESQKGSEPSRKCMCVFANNQTNFLTHSFFCILIMGYTNADIVILVCLLYSNVSRIMGIKRSLLGNFSSLMMLFCLKSCLYEKVSSMY